MHDFAKNSLYQKHFAQLKSPLAQFVKTLLLASDYACRQIDILQRLLDEDDCQRTLIGKNYIDLINQLPDQQITFFARELRQFRHRHLLRLMLRELSGLAETEETLTAWSDCADAIILRTIAVCKHELKERYGVPCDEAGVPTQLYILAMGKLGGRELNYSSDIDLIFTFSATGYTNGNNSVSNQEYYTKLVQLFIQLLQNMSEQGFVFRVDLRLRPNGESGALVCTLTTMEIYYQEQGRDWERYAMVKARLIGEDTDLTDHWFHRLITPFVYRRYVDFSVIESLRSMKAMILREVQLNPLLDDIKRGIGGIREVEFIIQNIQLIRGGRLPHLRQPNAMFALNYLSEAGFLPHALVLKQAYLFLRKMENALQSLNDQQTHVLPQDEIKQRQIVLLMGYDGWEQLIKKLHQYQRIISTVFSLTLRVTDSDEDPARVLDKQLMSVWQGHVEPNMAANLLSNLGFQQAERCYQMIYSFRHSPRCRRLSQAARMRLDRFMILLLKELTQITETDHVLLHVLHLLENIVGRSSYLALLTENPQVLKELLYWFIHSPFITSLFVGQPFLLEVLLDQKPNWKPPSYQSLEQALNRQLIHSCDTELNSELLRQFKLTNWLLAARSEIYGQSDAVRIGRFLADIAQVIINAVLKIACQQLVERYPQITQIKSRFAIIAYGKLGSREMNYNSDLDLVFIYTASSGEESLVTRLTQKILHMLTMRTATDILYLVDTRLRPSGSAGLLVSHMDAFVDYQYNQAWTWEHQALLRARVISGNQRVRFVFRQLKKDILLLPRNKELIRRDVLEMREKINQHLEPNAMKHVAGGLLDLEFLVQFLILVYPKLSFARHTHTQTLIEKLYSEHVLTQEQAIKLKEAYKQYHYWLHRNLLQPDPSEHEFVATSVMEVYRVCFNLSI